MTEKITEVAVAIFLKADGSFLLSSRPEGKPYAGYWEFPGGKIEPGESVLDAMTRELLEELNVRITDASPWFTFIMRYTHATVRLHCWRVRAWEGEMRGLEAQEFAWQTLEAIDVGPTLPGCVPIFRALALPEMYAITHAAELGAMNYLRRLEAALSRGLRLVQLREKTMAPEELAAFGRDVVELAHRHDARVLVNGDAALAARLGADGVHFTGAQLATLDARPAFPLVAASTHSRAEIERAAALGLDFVVLGPVRPTRTHPGAVPLGWRHFGALTDASPVPVYGLGGLMPRDLAEAQHHGAHGIALQRGLWEDHA